MGLTLVGSGIAFDLTMKGMESLKAADTIYIETYTLPMDKGLIEALEKGIEKRITLLEREKVESKYLVEEAKGKEVCLIVGGDPLTATTHIALIIDAKAAGIGVSVIHNSSIHSVAPGKCGLQAYRFGKTASLVNPRHNYSPKSSLDVIRDNMKRDAHTLVLLDTEPQPMEAAAALAMLEGFGSAVVISRAGYPDEKITYGRIEDLGSKDLGKPPFAMIIPAKLHPLEQEFLDSLNI